MIPKQYYPQQSIPTNLEQNQRPSNNGGPAQGPKNTYGVSILSSPDLSGNYQPNTFDYTKNQTSYSFDKFPNMNSPNHARQNTGCDQSRYQQNYSPYAHNGQHHENSYGKHYRDPHGAFSNPAPSTHDNNGGTPYMQPPPQIPNIRNDVTKKLLEKFADSVFTECDNNRSGFLDSREIYPAITMLFSKSGLPPPKYHETLQMMQLFDTDGNGLLDMSEFRALVYKMYQL